ncbi:MAG: GTPase [Candidatus Hermodarchaeota archaeon]
MPEKPSLLIIGNSNVGKSSITKLLLPNPKQFKGKTGKTPGSTLMIHSLSQPKLPYQIVDLPGFGYMKKSSRRREEHIKKQIIIHIEKKHQNYFLGLVVINILRIKDEIDKYLIQNKKTIPLSYELINFLREFNIFLLVVLNKIDKLSNFDKKKNIELFISSAREFDLNIVHIDEFSYKNELEVPYLELSALKKINIKKLKEIIQKKFRER